MLKTKVFTAFLLFCATYCTSKTRCHKHPWIWRPCPKHWRLQRFCLFVQHTVQVVEQDALSQAYKALAGLCRKCIRSPDKVSFGVCTKTLPPPVFSTVNLNKHVLFRVFWPFCLMCFAIDSVFSHGFGNVQQQAICKNSRRITGAVTLFDPFWNCTKLKIYQSVDREQWNTIRQSNLATKVPPDTTSSMPATLYTGTVAEHENELRENKPKP